MGDQTRNTELKKLLEANCNNLQNTITQRQTILDDNAIQNMVDLLQAASHITSHSNFQPLQFAIPRYKKGRPGAITKKYKTVRKFILAVQSTPLRASTVLKFQHYVSEDVVQQWHYCRKCTAKYLSSDVINDPNLELDDVVVIKFTPQMSRRFLKDINLGLTIIHSILVQTGERLRNKMAGCPI
jgi:hypothetical protein